MYKLIPKHCLVVTIGPSKPSREVLTSTYFSQEEIISAEKIAFDLIGETPRSDLNSVLFAEIRHRVSLKLRLGQRVVVQAANLRKEDRMLLAQIAIDRGVPLFYLLADPEGADLSSQQRWKAAEKDIMRGDGIAEVIDWRIHVPQPVPKALPSLEQIASRWNGLTVIADVHGMHHSLLSALSWARTRNHYVMFLGDVIDYGPGTLEVADAVYNVVMRGEGELMLGNHERKIFRWLSQEKNVHIRLSDGNRVTSDALTQLGSAAKARWQGRFFGLVHNASITRVLGNVVFAHAGVHSSFWTDTPNDKDVETWALFGEFDRTLPAASARKYEWTKSVPNHKTVIVGHDIRSTTRPFVVQNGSDSQIVFLDTGSGKGGYLSSVDLKFNDDGLRIGNYNMY